MSPMPAALTTELLRVIAGRFKVLSEPARLRLLNELRQGERTVSELVEATGFGQTSVSKHLHELHANGLVARRRSGPFVHYAIVDARVFQLCDLMCSQLRVEVEDRRKLVTGYRFTVRR